MTRQDKIHTYVIRRLDILEFSTTIPILELARLKGDFKRPLKNKRVLFGNQATNQTVNIITKHYKVVIKFRIGQTLTSMEQRHWFAFIMVSADLCVPSNKVRYVHCKSVDIGEHIFHQWYHFWFYSDAYFLIELSVCWVSVLADKERALSEPNCCTPRWINDKEGLIRWINFKANVTVGDETNASAVWAWRICAKHLTIASNDM